MVIGVGLISAGVGLMIEHKRSNQLEQRLQILESWSELTTKLCKEINAAVERLEGKDGA